MSRSKKLGLAFAFILSIPFLVVVLYSGFLQIGTWYAELTWRSRTTPLQTETVLDLCESLQLQDNNTICSLDRETYAPDFFPYIEDYFEDASKLSVTKEEVDQILKPYESLCEDKESLPSTADYFRCWYDLQGDNQHKFVIAFSFDGQVLGVDARIVVVDF